MFGVLALGEGWHNTHHAFPTSARHGLRWWQFDVSYWLIRGLACSGWPGRCASRGPKHSLRKGSRSAPETHLFVGPPPKPFIRAQLIRRTCPTAIHGDSAGRGCARKATI